MRLEIPPAVVVACLLGGGCNPRSAALEQDGDVVDAPAVDGAPDASPDARAIDAAPVDATIDAPRDAAITGSLVFETSPVHAGIIASREDNGVVFTVLNASSATLDINASVTATVTASVPATPCLQVAPGDTCSVVVVVIPPTTGDVSGTLTVTAATL